MRKLLKGKYLQSKTLKLIILASIFFLLICPNTIGWGGGSACVECFECPKFNIQVTNISGINSIAINNYSISGASLFSTVNFSVKSECISFCKNIEKIYLVIEVDNKKEEYPIKVNDSKSISYFVDNLGTHNFFLKSKLYVSNISCLFPIYSFSVSDPFYQKRIEDEKKEVQQTIEETWKQLNFTLKFEVEKLRIQLEEEKRERQKDRIVSLVGALLAGIIGGGSGAILGYYKFKKSKKGYSFSDVTRS